MIELLAALSAAAAASIRVALPLLAVGLLQGDKLWSNVPILSQIYPAVVLGVLASWSLVELFASKYLLGQRLLQLVQLLFSPIVGALMAIAAAPETTIPTGLIGLISSIFALLLQLVQAGWFYRRGGLPVWLVFVQDSLCLLLVFLALNAPQLGGVIALMMLVLAIVSFKKLRRWYTVQKK